ncbi:MAG: cytochrome-c peroxidase [Rhodospirillaceae bacterium]
MRAVFALVAVVAPLVLVAASYTAFAPAWTADELKDIQALSLASLPALPPDPSNRVAEDPAAAALGKKLFFDAALSANGEVSCATCHKPGRQYQDDLPAGRGMMTGNRRTMPIAGTAYAPFLFWDGRKDSQWSQALGPLENPAEHGADRTMIVRHVAGRYAAEYTRLFGGLPDVTRLPEHAAPGAAAWKTLPAQEQTQINRVFANVGKAIAAFERTVAPQPARFDIYAAALARGDTSAAARVFSARERNGLRLFIGKADCLKCHNGPLFTDNAFHNIGLPSGSREAGRSAAVAAVLSDPFNCLGAFSDAGEEDCDEVRFMETEGATLFGAFRSPSLRGVAQRPPYTHSGDAKSIRAVLEHYNKAPQPAHGHSELKPLGLDARELEDLEAFLGTLGG